VATTLWTRDGKLVVTDDGDPVTATAEPCRQWRQLWVVAGTPDCESVWWERSGDPWVEAACSFDYANQFVADEGDCSGTSYGPVHACPVLPEEDDSPEASGPIGEDCCIPPSPSVSPSPSGSPVQEWPPGCRGELGCNCGEVSYYKATPDGLYTAEEAWEAWNADPEAIIDDCKIYPQGWEGHLCAGGPWLGYDSASGYWYVFVCCCWPPP
jgi:hypothetical protein